MSAKRILMGFRHPLAQEDSTTTAFLQPRGRRARLFTLIFGLLFATAYAADDLALNRWTIDGGGEMSSTGGELELSGTIAQPDAGAMTGAALELTGGFWFSVASGDCNTDGGVNLVDFDSLHACVFGPGGGVAQGCTCFDMDHDSDVDMSDVVKFQQNFDGV